MALTGIAFFIISVCLIASSKGGLLISHVRKRACIFLLSFALTGFLSTAFSPFGVASLLSRESRSMGAFYLLALYLCFYLTSLFPVPGKTIQCCFLFSGFLVELMGILHFSGYDVLGFQAHVPYHMRGMYLSTIGYINFFSEYVSLVTILAIAMFCQKPRLLLLPVLFIGYLSLLIANCDGGIAGLMVGVLLLPVLAKGEKGLLKRLFTALFLFPSACASACFLYGRSDRGYVDAGLPAFLTRPAVFCPLFLFICAGLLICIGYEKCRRKNMEGQHPETRQPIGYGGILLSVFIFLLVCYLISHAKTQNGLFWIPDDWASNRGYIWKQVWKAWKEAPFLQKLLGYGPDTLKSVLLKGKEEALAATGQYYDSAHNVVLQYLITTGAAGVACITAFFVSLFQMGFKTFSRHWIYITVLLVGLFQTFFVPLQPVVNPLLYITAGLCVTEERTPDWLCQTAK